MNWNLLWRGLLFKNTVRSRCCILLLHCWWRKYFSRAPLRNMTQLHHSKTVKYRRTCTHTANIQTPRAHKRSVHPSSCYSCSEGGVIKHKAREFFKDLLKSGFITQLPEQQPKLQLPDMSAFDSSG